MTLSPWTLLTTALCHAWYDDKLYNGYLGDTIRSTSGAARLRDVHGEAQQSSGVCARVQT